MSRLYLIRHGSTAANEGDEVLRGWLDYRLSPTGERQAQHLGAKLMGSGISTIYASDLSRGLQTAQAIQAHTNAKIVPTSGLRPWHLGALAGQRIKDVKAQMQHLVDSGQPAPGGEGFPGFLARALPTLGHLMTVAKASPTPIAAVTHTRNLQAFEAWLDKGGQKLAVDPSVIMQEPKVQPGEMKVIDFPSYGPAQPPA